MTPAPEEGACWPWNGRRTKEGYGIIPVYRGAPIYVHRLMLEVTLGRHLAPGEQARHSCDNPPCFRPDHLLAGSAADNAQDAVRRGRHVSNWPKDGRSGLKMTPYIARSMRLLRKGGWKLTDIGALYGFSPQRVSDACTRRNWGRPW